MQDYNKADMVMCWQSLGTEGFKSHSSTGECSGCVLSHNKNEALLFDRNYLQKRGREQAQFEWNYYIMTVSVGRE